MSQLIMDMNNKRFVNLLAAIIFSALAGELIGRAAIRYGFLGAFIFSLIFVAPTVYSYLNARDE